MDAEEQEICDFMKSWSDQYVSAREIARRAGGKRKYKDNPYWAAKPLMRLVERGVMESDSSGRYRMKPLEDRTKPRRWISPHLKRILRDSGKDFETILEEQRVEKEEEKPEPKEKHWSLNDPPPAGPDSAD